jgi:hypothetical protein
MPLVKKTFSHATFGTRVIGLSALDYKLFPLKMLLYIIIECVERKWHCLVPKWNCYNTGKFILLFILSDS